MVSTIQKTQQETELIRDMISETDSHVSNMSGSIMEISAVMESVNKLSGASNKIITFLDKIILKDYDKLETLADNYKGDAQYYVEVSNALGTVSHQTLSSADDIQFSGAN